MMADVHDTVAQGALPAMEGTPYQIAFAACEPSADRQAAALLKELRQIAAPRRIEAWGIGGTHLRDAGMQIRHDSDPWATIGIAAAMAHLPHGLAVRSDFKRALSAAPPDALVLVDAGAFNIPIGKWAKAQRLCPVFYYFPSGSWRQTPTQGLKRMAEAADQVVTPFPWSETLLNAAGANARFVGHPLLDLVAPSMDAPSFFQQFGLDPHRPLVALLPGSRRIELQNILPPLLGAADEIARRIPGVQFAIGRAPSVSRTLMEEMIRREQGPGGRAARLHLLMSQAGDKLAHIAQSTLNQTLPPARVRLATNEGLALPSFPEAEDEPLVIKERSAPAQAPLVVVDNMTYDVMAHSDLVLTASGTATLEAAILQKPMVIVYRVPSVVALEGRMRWKRLGISHIGMPNILAQERVVPELLQDEVTPMRIADLAVGLLLQPERLLAIKERLGQLTHRTLGEPGGVHRAAQHLYDMINHTLL